MNETFPQFKRRIYSKDATLPAELQELQAAYIVMINFNADCKSVFKKISGDFESVIKKIYTKQLTNNSAMIENLNTEFAKSGGLPTYKAQNICEIFIALPDSYVPKIFNRISGKETYYFT